MKAKFHKKDVRVEKREALHEGFLSIFRYRLQHRLFNGGWSEAIDRELMDRGDAVMVIPYDPKSNELVVLEQFRVGAMENEHGPWLFEFVAGMFDADESAEQVAERELMEEAGLKAEQLHYALSYYSSPGGTNERLSIYIAKVNAADAIELGGIAEENEDIRVSRIDFNEAVTMLEKGYFNNAASVIGLQWMQLHADQLFND